MSHHRNRLVLAILAALVIAVPVGVFDLPAFADCSQADRNAGECRSIDGSASDNQVTIRVDSSTSGSSGTAGGSPSSSGGSSSSATPEHTAPPPSPPIRRGPPPPPRLPTLGSSDCQVMIAGMCRGTSPGRNQPAPPAVEPSPSGATIPATPPTPPRSVSELGQFTPEQPGLTIQPGEWSMPRLPTNVVARARTHVQSGELAGWPIEVRFIPHRYHWSFGDGNRKTFAEAGRTWAALGLRQFQPTPTSHVYDRPGSYQLSVQVEYRAEFRFVGESWQPLSGTVSSTSQTSRVRVLTVSPLLLGD